MIRAATNKTAPHYFVILYTILKLNKFNHNSFWLSKYEFLWITFLIQCMKSIIHSFIVVPVVCENHYT
jgi:hypothetical protein